MRYFKVKFAKCNPNIYTSLLKSFKFFYNIVLFQLLNIYVYIHIYFFPFIR